MKTSLESGQSITYWALGWDRPALSKLVNYLGIHPFWAHLFTKIDQQNWLIDYEFTQTFWSLFTSFYHKGRLQKVKKQKLDTARTVSFTTHLLQTRSFSIWMPSQEIQDPPFKPQFGGFKRIFCVHPDPCEIMKSDLIVCFNWLETHQPPTTWHTPLPRYFARKMFFPFPIAALYYLGVYPNQVVLEGDVSVLMWSYRSTPEEVDVDGLASWDRFISMFGSCVRSILAQDASP